MISTTAELQNHHQVLVKSLKKIKYPKIPTFTEF